MRIKTNPLTRLRKHKFITAIIAVLLIGAGFWGYEVYTRHANKVAFEQARVAIDTIYADIVTQIGPPDDYRRINECSRPSTEFEQGPLFCDIGSDFIYGVADKQEADQLLTKINKIIQNHSSILKSTNAPSSDIYVSPAPGNNTDSSVSYYKTASGMECRAKNTYDMPREIQLNLKDSSKKGLGVSLGCSEEAKTQHYPLHSAN